MQSKYLPIAPSLKEPLITKPLNMYAFFAGGGGMHLGFEEAGFNLVLASDIMKAAEETHLYNNPDVPFLREDIRKLTAERVLQAAGGVRPDIIVGGPPCQGFSTLGDKLSGDPRNVLFETYAHLVEELEPKFFVLENVKSLVTLYNGQFKDHIIGLFNKIGYRVSWTVLDAADFGVPQFRKRVFFFGTRCDAPFSFPEPSHGPTAGVPYVTTWDAIEHLVHRGIEIPNHIALDHSERVIARYKLIPEGGRLPPPDQLPPEIRRANFGNTYKRLDRYRPALTMVPGNNAFPVHPVLHRSLTPREAACLQTFPEDLVFMGDRRTQCILVGNAVPPKLARALAESIQCHARLEGGDFESPQMEIEVPPENLTRINDARHNAGFVDLFCGAGGFTIGLQKAGWGALLGVDINRHVEATHTHNFPKVNYEAADLGDNEVRRRLAESLVEKNVALVAGGPPCQGFSVFGKRRFVNTRGYAPHEDPRNRLVFAFIDFVRQVQPRWFLMENVPGLANLDDGQFLNVLLDEFRHVGYPNVEFRILNAADYGVPQLRRRLIIIGNRTGHIIPWPKKKFFAAPKDWQDRHRGVGEVITDLSSDKSYDRVTCHVPIVRRQNIWH